MPRRSARSRRIAIVGGGIGGLTAALCLARTGNHVDIYEKADAIAEVGAGIQLSPNCTGVLHMLGLEALIRRTACLPRATEIYHWRTGETLARAELGRSALDRFGSPYYHIHRADLVHALVSMIAMRRNISVHTHSEVRNIEICNDSVIVGVGGDRKEVDLLVGADGIHSTVREAVFGSSPSRFTGNVAWRALVPSVRLSQVELVTKVFWGPGKHFVHYLVRGGELMNLVGVTRKPDWNIESWTEPGDVAEFKADFTGWYPGVRAMIDALDETTLFRWALYDRAPLPAWSKGHATLLGDACHATLPFAAQGAAMAIEDAAVLARCLDREGDTAAALSRYEAMRRDRTVRIQRASRRNATIYHLSGIPAWFRNRFAQKAGEATMDWLYRYDPLM